MKAISTKQLQSISFSFQPGSAVWQPIGFLLIAVILGFGIIRLPLLWTAASLVAMLVFLLILIRPLLGLGLVLLLGPFGALENIILGGSIVDSGQLLLLFTLMVWLARGLMRRRIRLHYTFLNLPLVLFVGISAITLLNAPSTADGIKELIKWIEIGLIMLVVVAEGISAREKKDVMVIWGLRNHIWVVLGMLLLAGLSQAIIGIWQFGLRGTGPTHFIVLGRFYRAYGTYEQPNPFGGFMNLTVLLAAGALIGLIITYWQNRKPSPFTRSTIALGVNSPMYYSPGHIAILLFVAGCAATTGLALVFSWSRGAWLGFAGGVVALILFWPRKWWRGVASLVAAVTIGAGLFLFGMRWNLIPGGVVDRISDYGQELQFGDVRGVDINDTNYSVLERLAHWQAALNMARDNIWLGVGFGNYEQAYPEYSLINWPDALGHAHNYYLNILAEVGVLGISAYLLFWAAVIWQTLRLLAYLDWPERGIALGLLATWVAFSIHQLVDKLYVNNIYIHLGVMLGLLQLLERGERPARKASNTLPESKPDFSTSLVDVVSR